VLDQESPAGRAYQDAVARFLGEQREMRFIKPGKRKLFRSLLARAG
jgi:septum site-determining protein MinD